MSSQVSDVFGLGPYLRAQRRLAKLSLRQMADLAGVSNPYLSQIERGLHEPSVRILRSIAEALNLSAETVLEQAGLLSREDAGPTDTETAIRHDPELSEDQKLALLSVYRSYRDLNGTGSRDRAARQSMSGANSPGEKSSRDKPSRGKPATVRNGANGGGRRGPQPSGPETVG